MKRRLFLTLALAACSLGVAGCGRQKAEAAPEMAPEITSQLVAPATANPSSDELLNAPPLAAKSNPINEGMARIPNRLKIPAIEVDIPVVELGWSQKSVAGQIFNEWDVAAHAAGWHKNSALPGDGGNIVMSGHNNIMGAVFRELDQLKKGDPITVWMSNHLFTYTVDQVVVLPYLNVTEEQLAVNAHWIGPFDEERLTLVSCWPRNNNTHRIVVVAHPQLTAQSSR
jgi:sortase A